jgi:hypothetical protein
VILMPDILQSRTASAIPALILATTVGGFLTGCKPAEVKPDPAAEAQAEAMMEQYDKRPAAAGPSPARSQ